MPQPNRNSDKAKPTSPTGANATVRWRCCAACRSKWRAGGWYRSSAPAARARRRCCRSSGRSRARRQARRSAASTVCFVGQERRVSATVVGFVCLQFHHLLPEFTAFETSACRGLIGGRDRREVGARRRSARFDGVSRHAATTNPPRSGGEQQRAAIARALINSPSVLLADEPSGNLDTHNREEIHRLFFELRERLGQTVVIVTHDESLAARADRTITMSDGRIVG